LQDGAAVKEGEVLFEIDPRLYRAEAVMVEEGTRYVFVVTGSNVIEKRPVVLGPPHGDLRLVREGLRPEDRVVIGRLRGLQPGMAVRPREGDKPSQQRDKPGPVKESPAPASAPDKDQAAEAWLGQREFPPLLLEFLDGRPMVAILANPESGVSPAQVPTLCTTLMAEVHKELRLSAEYCLSWLQELPEAE
jgi:hypothetical protein